MDERTLARFMSKVEVQANGCWHWTAWRNHEGYGYFRYLDRDQGAHRVAYEHFIGPIPDGRVSDHLCHTRDLDCPGGPRCPHRGCVNPHHIEPTIQWENVRRGRGVPAQNLIKEFCKNGHPLDDSYRYSYPGRGRVERSCKKCHTEYSKEWYKENRWQGGLNNLEKTHCPQGHPYSGDNLYTTARGGRACRTCRREQDRLRRLRKGGSAEVKRATDTHCANGHERTSENTYAHPDGYRVCRICQSDALRRHRQRKSATS